MLRNLANYHAIVFRYWVPRTDSSQLGKANFGVHWRRRTKVYLFLVHRKDHLNQNERGHAEQDPVAQNGVGAVPEVMTFGEQVAGFWQQVQEDVAQQPADRKREHEPQLFARCYDEWTLSGIISGREKTKIRKLEVREL